MERRMYDWLDVSTWQVHQKEFNLVKRNYKSHLLRYSMHKPSYFPQRGTFQILYFLPRMEQQHHTR